MIRIHQETLKKQNNFWNHCLFHPTDAVEDAWGKRILDRMAEDGAVRTVRIYTMFEDIVYLDENGQLQYDFRVSDLRLDYLLEKGYDLLLAYAGMPDCIARSTASKTSVSKNKTRYKGKLFNTSPPRDYALWEEICYAYTRHNVERYGIDVVARWHCHCFNEPDISAFFMGEMPETSENTAIRCAEYCRLYAAFERGVRRVSDRIPIGGPALAHNKPFLADFLDYVKENNLKLDYIAFHNYGTSYRGINERGERISVQNNLRKHQAYMEIIREHGFGDVEIIADEWGAAAQGFFNIEECPAYIFRETEVFSAYYVKLIRGMIDLDPHIAQMMICLSGQHEMVTDFSGFRNFFTLNFITKPIYNAYILASKLGENLLAAETTDEHIAVIPTRQDNGNYAVLLSYSSENFEADLPALDEPVVFAGEIADKAVTVWCIDKTHTNPYRLYQRMDKETPTEEDLRCLREEGRLKPVAIQSGREPLTLNLTANCTYLITVTDCAQRMP